MKSEPDSNMTAEHDETIVTNDILLVDDEIPNLKLLVEFLGQAGYRVRPTEKPQLAIDSALAKPPALILLDVKMPEMNGFEVCRHLKQDKRTRGVPIIFISALQDVQDRVLGFEAGGVDFITKPFHKKEVLARVRTHMDLHNMQLHLEKMVAERTEAVFESEQRFRATFEQAAVGIAHISTEGRFLRINDKFCDIVGYTEDEMLSMTFHVITHPDDLDSDLEYIRQVLNGEIETYTMDKRYYRKDGSTVWVNLTVSLLFSRGGLPKYFVAVAKDISARKQAEEALRQSHDFLDHLTSAVPDAIFSIKMPERIINWANDSFNVLGYAPEEYIGQSTQKYYANAEDYDKVGKLWNEAIRKGDEIIRTEVEVHRKDRKVIPVELTATFYREEQKLSRVTALVRDISERKLAEEKLARSEAKYRGLVDNSLVGVFNSTIDGRLLFVNDAMARMFDFDSPETMLTEGVQQRWSDPEDRNRMLSRLRQYGRVTNFETETITHTNRHIHVLFSAKQLGNSIVGMLMDITERKKAEQKIVDYQQRLKTMASRLTLVEEKERNALAADLHDYIGQSMVLARMQLSSARKLTSEARLADKFDSISDTLLRVLKETRMLMLGLSAPAINELGLSSAISEWLESQVSSRHDLKIEVIDNIPQHRGRKLDPNVRLIMFRNVRELLVNVLKHAQADKVIVRLEDRGTGIRIIVQDDGIGFDPTPSLRADSSVGGFGLFSIENLMADLGGSLKIVARLGKGCTAILTVPRCFEHNRGRD